MSSLLKECAFLSLLVCSANVCAAEGEKPVSPTMATLKSISTDSSEDKTSIYIEFDAPLTTEKPAIEEHGTFLQFQLKNTIVINPGNFIDGSGPYIQKIVPFQTNPKDAAIRLFVDRKAVELLGATHVDTLDNRLLVTVDHTKIAVTDGLNAKVAAISKEMSKSDDKLSVTTPAGDVAAGDVAADPLPTEVAQISKGRKDSLNLQSKMVIAAVFCLAVLLVGALIVVFRPSMRQRLAGVPTEIPTFRTLSSHSIGPKQKIAIVKVGNERLLLGVTPGSISLLKNLDEVVAAPQATLQPRINLPMPERQATVIERTKPETQRTLPERLMRTASAEPEKTNEYEGVKVDLRNNPRSLSRSPGKIAKPTLPRPAPSKVKAGSVDDVTKLIREKLKNLPQAT